MRLYEVRTIDDNNYSFEIEANCIYEAAEKYVESIANENDEYIKVFSKAKDEKRVFPLTVYVRRQYFAVHGHNYFLIRD